MSTTRSGRKICGLCNASINETEYRAHVAKCGMLDNDEVKPVLKTCAFCRRQVQDLTNHYQKCTGGDSSTDNMSENYQQSSIIQNHQQRTITPTNRINTEEYAVYSQRIANDTYADHVDRCAFRSPSNFESIKKTKQCALCFEMVAENEYVNHIEKCALRLRSASKPVKKTKQCALCFEKVAENEYVNHIEGCALRFKDGPEPIKKTKQCAMCFEMVAENEYINHIDQCSQGSSPMSAKRTQRHKDFSKESSDSKYPTRIHTNVSLSASSSYAKSKSSPRHPQPTCFTCSSPLNSSENSHHTVPCRSRHVYCLTCLRRSMNEYIQSNIAPVCHSTLCDYEFSKYDIACLPIEQDSIQRLLTCVKSTQRVQCPVCNFYIDFKSMDDYQRHVTSCNSENMIPCEYCFCPYKTFHLNDHSQQCRNTSSSQRQQALIDFILPRTKYPLTAAQIRVFIENRKKPSLPSDPHSIIEALAEFEGTFPFEVPTRECDVCMESCAYDDIFVFGCENNHKLCYECFEHSCTTKMNNDEALTCGMCPYQLQDGEIKQLRVTNDRMKQFLDYQVQKTFIIYAVGTQGVIRCPNRACKWIAEVQNPNDRFKVECPMCKYEFCSLCNQQYHYRTTCQQIPDITQRWFFWCNTERGNYWQARAQQDANFRAQLEDFERQKTANIQRNQDLAQRYNELLADENFKAQSCRLCPHCRRVTERISGCDSMVCGRNYHGGDQQSGCGKAFNWTQALPYVPIADMGVQQVRNDMPPPEQQKLIVHQGVQCDACQGEVQGIRFDCMHCASLTFCEKCEQRATLEHSNEIRKQQKQQHVFRLITEPLSEHNRQ